jgi:hypothetical protein
MKTLLLAALLIFGLNASAKEDTKAYLEALKKNLNRYGAAKIEGMEDVAGKPAPVLFFGSKKINNNFDVVDNVKKSHGGTATVFVKSGDEFVRVSTNVLKDDGTRAVGTQLARNKAYETVVQGNTYCGPVEILGKPYDTCYEPIKDAAGKTVGLYYVGYLK